MLLNLFWISTIVFDCSVTTNSSDSSTITTATNTTTTIIAVIIIMKDKMLPRQQEIEGRFWCRRPLELGKKAYIRKRKSVNEIFHPFTFLK